MSNFLRSKKTKATLIILGAIALLLLVFGLGISVGYRKAIFASRYGENYYLNFSGAPPGGFFGLMTGGTMPMSGHGLVGIVIDLASSTISVRDQNNTEQSVHVSADTVIREMNATVPVNDVEVGDPITVIGEPNEVGQIEARFIRIFEASTSLPAATNFK
jgi:hypothetical protein